MRKKIGRLWLFVCAVCGALVPLTTTAFSVDEAKSAASTGVFGYDRATLPKTGSALRTDVFATAGSADRAFHLDDLVVLGYDKSKGSAGAFWFYVVGFDAGADSPGVKRETDGAKRELAFYWYDVPSGDRMRSPGWYDADGETRWENLAFTTGDAFCFQGNGLTLETNGLVFDTSVTNEIASVDSAIVANNAAKRVKLGDMRILPDASGEMTGDVRLRSLANDLTVSNEWTWATTASGVGWTSGEDVSFDLGEAFWLRMTDASSSPAAPSAAPLYRWKATAGGIAAPGDATNVTGVSIYLFDARTLSSAALLTNLCGGASLASQPFVLGRTVEGGVLKTTDDFSYEGGPVGTSWEAYMAVECEVNGRRYAYLSESVTVMGVAFGFATIAFDAPASANWREISSDALKETLSPGEGTSERQVLAADAIAATNQLRIVSPDETVVSSADYAKYFKLVATPLSEGTYLVRAELDAEAIELDKTSSDLAANLSTLAGASGGATLTIEVTSKAGLTYRVLSSASVNGTYEKGAGSSATGERTSVEVKVPEGNSGFFKIEAGVK